MSIVHPSVELINYVVHAPLYFVILNIKSVLSSHYTLVLSTNQLYLVFRIIDNKMSGKKRKGMSLEEKRTKLLQMFYDKKEVLNLKEVEKFGAKRGIVL